MAADTTVIPTGENVTITLPCGHDAGLRFHAFVRTGARRASDIAVVQWHVRCEVCGGNIYSVFQDVRYYVRRLYGTTQMYQDRVGRPYYRNGDPVAACRAVTLTEDEMIP